MKNKHSKLLLIGAILMIICGIGHLVAIAWLWDVFELFGITDFALLHYNVNPVLPVAATLAVAIAFFIAGAYGLSASSYIRKLPLLKPAIFAIGAVFALRGIVGLSVLAVHPDRVWIELVSSLVALTIGVLYLVGGYNKWRKHHLTLRKLDPRSDLKQMEKWLHEPHVIKYFGQPESWLTEIEREAGSQWIHHYIVESDGTPVGFAQYYDTAQSPQGDWSAAPADSAGIDYMVGEKEYVNRGLGSKIASLVIDQIRSENRYKHVVADPMARNAKSASVLKSNGFRKFNKNLYILDL